MIRFKNILLALALLGSGVVPAHAAGSQAAAHEVHLVTVAGERIEIGLPFSMNGFIESATDDAVQIATAVQWEPFLEVSLSADPLPSALSSEGQANDPLFLADEAMNTLQRLRDEQAAVPLHTHRLGFFGQERESVSNQVLIHLKPLAKEPVIIHEWVSRTGNDLWTFRVSYTPGQGFAEALLDQIVVRLAGPAEPDGRLNPGPQPIEAKREFTGAVSSQLILADSLLPTPAWWIGECDTTNYEKVAGVPAYPLGGIYRGVKACGPRPWYDDAPDVLVRFFVGAWGEYEWECVELSMRYLYLAYNIAPYPGNGKDVVANYPGTLLIKVSNGSWGGPQPGDVLSYGPTTTYGHTSVVSASNIDLDGNGTITVVEQNSSATGVKTLTVVDWYVQSSMAVSGWLHDPTGDLKLPPAVYLPLIRVIN